MRHVLGFALVLAIGASSLSVSAQGSEEAATSGQEPEESTLSDEPVGDEGTLSPRVRKRTREQWDPDTFKLRLDSSGLSLSRPRPRPPSEETDARLRQYRKGVIVSSLALGIGGALIGAGVVVLRNWQDEESQEPSFELTLPGGAILLFTVGSVAALGGLIGAATSGSKLSTRRKTLRELRAAHRRKPARVEWDPSGSGFVF